MPNKEIKTIEKRLSDLRAERGEVADEEIVDAINDLAYAYYRIDPQKTERHAREAGELAELLDYQRGLGRSLVVLGVSFWARSEYGNAMVVFKEGSKVYENIGHKQGIADTYVNIGLVYSAWGDYEQALEFYLNALSLNEELGNINNIADINNNIGIIYKNRNDYDRAVEHFHIALVTFEKMGDKTGIAGIYNNIGIINERLKEYANALEYFLKSIELRVEIGEKGTIADSYNNIGEIYEAQSDFDLSLEYYNKSLKIKEEIGDKHGIATSYIGIGNVYTSLKEYGTAQKYLEDALRIAEDIGVKRQEMQCYQRLSELFEASGDIEKSYEYYKTFTDMEKALFSEDKNRQLTEIRTKYEFEKKEKEAEIYRLKNVELQAAYDKTDELLRNILPEQIVKELEETSAPKPRIVNDVTVVFVDIVNFTLSANKNEPDKLLAELALHFGAYDEIVKGYALEKLKTFGDGYMYAGGLFSDGNQVKACTETALDIMDFVRTREWEVRVGIHIGPCIAGLIKGWRMIYDVWGETVNMAARLEQTGEPGRVNVSQIVCDELGDAFNLESRGEIAAHNLGPTPMYFVLDKRVT